MIDLGTTKRRNDHRLGAAGSRILIPLDDALSTGTFQIAAELGRLFSGSERADHGAVIDPLGAEIDALDDRRTGSQRGRKLVLQRAVGGLRVGLVLLRGDLNQIIAAG